MALGRMLGDSWGTRIIRILFLVGAVLTVAFLALIPADMGEANAAKALLSDGERATATGAQGRAEVREKNRSGVDRREIMDPQVKASVALADGSIRELTLNDPDGAPETAYQQDWAPAPAPYQGTFDVVYAAADPAGTVMAVTDAQEEADYTPVGSFVLAGLSLLFTLAFLFPFLRTLRKPEHAVQA